MSSLVDKLKEVCLSGGNLSGDDGKYLEKHVVHDVPDSFASVKIIFLMESPHIDEKRRGYPLAGVSGENITMDLIKLIKVCSGMKSNDPIGELVKYNKISWLSIMNVCLLPLQKTPYENREKASDAVRTLWGAFEEIREKVWKKHDLCPIGEEVYDAIINDLGARIEQVKARCQSPLLVIPFGHIARQSLERAIEADSQLQFSKGMDVPHPAACKWKTWDKNELAVCIDAWLKGSL